MTELTPRKTYRDSLNGEEVEFVYMGLKGLAIVCEPGDSGGGMQSCWGVKPDRLTPMGTDIKSAFHALWTKAVGQKGYDKKEWQRLAELLRAEKVEVQGLRRMGRHSQHVQRGGPGEQQARPGLPRGGAAEVPQGAVQVHRQRAPGRHRDALRDQQHVVLEDKEKGMHKSEILVGTKDELKLYFDAMGISPEPPPPIHLTPLGKSRWTFHSTIEEQLDLVNSPMASSIRWVVWMVRERKGEGDLSETSSTLVGTYVHITG